MDGEFEEYRKPKDSGKQPASPKDYASCGVMAGESFSLLIPAFQGYGLHIAQQDDEQYIFPNSVKNPMWPTSSLEKLNAPEDRPGRQLCHATERLPLLGRAAITNGPVYLGAIICFLFILGMFCWMGKHKWWILAASVLGILLSQGAQPAGGFFNYFMFDYFRCIINSVCPPWQHPQMLFPIVASLVMEKLISGTEQSDWKKFLRGFALR